ncbi:hypothetical protein Bbelb_439930 [Branchiostoma belcheri]|nr:hypothetical protein Bbelb_439930 [Branchiostoma belcheri]
MVGDGTAAVLLGTELWGALGGCSGTPHSNGLHPFRNTYRKGRQSKQANPGPQIVASDILLWREVMTSTRFLRKKMADVMTGKNRFFSALKGCFCDKGPPRVEKNTITPSIDGGKLRSHALVCYRHRGPAPASPR